MQAVPYNWADFLRITADEAASSMQLKLYTDEMARFTHSSQITGTGYSRSPGWPGSTWGGLPASQVIDDDAFEVRSGVAQPAHPPGSSGSSQPSLPSLAQGMSFQFAARQNGKSQGLKRPQTQLPSPARGLPGFDDAEFVAGAAYGYRWWSVKAPPLWLNPFSEGSSWNPGPLHSARDIWQPGVNIARCIPYGGLPLHPDSEIPHEQCGCGFWAYWKIQEHGLGGSQDLKIVGVIEGSGQVLNGPVGFRAAKARIVALHVPVVIEPDLPDSDPYGSRYDSHPHQYGRHNPWWNHPQFHGRVIQYASGGNIPAPYAPPPPPEPTAEAIREAEDRAEAWTAVINDRLQLMYPDAEVCADLKLMLAKYPVVSEYQP